MIEHEAIRQERLHTYIAQVQQTMSVMGYAIQNITSLPSYCHSIGLNHTPLGGDILIAGSCLKSQKALRTLSDAVICGRICPIEGQSLASIFNGIDARLMRLSHNMVNDLMRMSVIAGGNTAAIGWMLTVPGLGLEQNNDHILNGTILHKPATDERNIAR